MDESKVPSRDTRCRNCSHLVVPSEVMGTDGLCIPCWKAWLKSKYGRGIPHTVRLRLVEIPQRLYDLFESCQVYCMLTCCGLNAVELSEETIAAWYSGLATEAQLEFQAQFRQMLEFASANQLPLFFFGDKYTVDEFYNEIQPITDYLKNKVKMA